MSLRVCVAESKTYLNTDDLVSAVACRDYPFRLDVLLDQVSFEPDTREELDGTLWLEVGHVHKLFNWYNRTAPPEQLPRIGGLLRAIKVEQADKRKHARKHRWLVAYRQNYVCFSCNQLLHPDAWECDHDVELRDGGSDSYSGTKKNARGLWDDNLRALCVDCHSKKTKKRTRNGAPAPPTKIPTTTSPRGNTFSKYFQRN